MSAVHEDWSVARFETERPELCAFLKNGPIAAMEKNCPRILIRAPVKSGKRQMVQYIARRDSAVAQQRVHGFVSAWHRAADESQRKEMGPYGVQVWSGLDQKKVKGFNTWVTLRIKQGKHIVLHLDECDHGSGERQILGEIWRRWNKDERVTFILYSATPEEVIYSSEIEDEDEDDAMLQEMITEGLRFNYTPPAGFCGPQRFLRENLVHEAKPFFVKTDDGFSLSAQGKEIVAQMLASMAVDRRRNVLVLRLTYSEGGGKRAEKKDNKAIYQFLRNIKAFPELSSFDISVDKGEGTMSFADVTTEKIQWSSKKWWDRLTTDKPFMFVCDQTSSRSTEWAFHDRVYATHDYRNQLTFSVASQAQERVSHYESKYGGCFQPIKVYGHKKTFQLSAGEIDYETYLNDEWEKRKLDKRKTGDQELYQIRKTADKTPHPAYPQPVSELEANRILQDLGCLAESTLSARVRGRIGLVPVVESTFVPCTKESFETLRAAGKFGQGWANTFIAAEKLGLVNGKYQGKIRGTIAVRTYDEVIREIWAVSNSHTHHQIVCYKDDECGICVRKVVGQESMDRLTAYKSMYAPRR
jgi:hypothetical protein